jgi:hypothetical protein
VPFRGQPRVTAWTKLSDPLEDYVSAKNPVRFLDAFVGSLDLLLCRKLDLFGGHWATHISCSKDWRKCASNGA